MKRGIIFSVFILILLISGWAVELFWSAGQFKKLDSHFSGECNPVAGLIGPEDISIDPIRGIAYISACDRRAVGLGKPGNGGIFSYDLNASEPKLIHLTPEADADFQPHGICLYTEGDRVILFAVNHQGGKHTIEIYDIKNGKLFHKKTLSDPMLVSPNDLVATGPDTFYVTNDHRYVSGMKRTMEEYFKLKLSNVLFYTGTKFIEAASGIGYANGINLSPDGSRLYVCAITERSLHVYDRNTSNNQITHRQQIKLNTGADNIEIDDKGNLWIGAHPKLLSFVKYSKDPAQISPSQILHLIPKADGSYEIREIYLNTGEEISGSSVGAVMNSRLLIGSVFDPKFLDCRIE